MGTGSAGDLRQSANGMMWAGILAIIIGIIALLLWFRRANRAFAGTKPAETVQPPASGPAA